MKICPVKAIAYQLSADLGGTGANVDTLRKIPAMTEYRDRVAKELGIKLIVHTNRGTGKIASDADTLDKIIEEPPTLCKNCGVKAICEVMT